MPAALSFAASRPEPTVATSAGRMLPLVGFAFGSRTLALAALLPGLWLAFGRRL